MGSYPIKITNLGKHTLIEISILLVTKEGVHFSFVYGLFGFLLLGTTCVIAKHFSFF